MIKAILVFFASATLALAEGAGDAARFSGAAKLSGEGAKFGGFSAIHVYENGQEFLALSDHGLFLRGVLERKDGTLTGVIPQEQSPVRKIDGGAVSGNNSDSEGIAVAQNGDIFVSFEGFHRVRKYTDIDGNAAHISGHARFKSMQQNSSLEALAIDKNGVLYTMPERSGHEKRPFPIYRYQGGAWDIYGQVPRDHPFLMVGADIGPDGRFYVLERHFAGFGFATQLRSFAMGQSGLRDERRHLRTRTGRHDNLEGISVWRDPQGNLRATMISDDNFRFFLASEIVEYILP
ncbi:hypothetical protein GCM10007939_16480 [Amylibacter marinus]|uniref:Phytase-like domain-containing protein n=1 Tax=Amylibacter marinus TaxID=1475483 RepID=A0ABQ5VVS3_9RHOB|nr:esterase-like activity of phytase family protein [Amylibacter marinus]GLQ35365.1 hypothetical protein GCM10007939_16480 [Amylibacter marinus]